MSEAKASTLVRAPAGAQDADHMIESKSPNMAGWLPTGSTLDPMAGPCDPLNPEKDDTHWKSSVVRRSGG